MCNELDLAAAKADLNAAVQELRSLISCYDPIVLLGRVATYIITTDPDEPKDSGGPTKSETNLEYLVSLIAAHSVADGLPSPTPDVVQRCIDLLTKIQMVASVCLMTWQTDASTAEAAIDDFVSAFRMEKLHVRGDGYWPHLRLTIFDLLQPHDATLAEVLGFTSTDYMAFMERTETDAQKFMEAELEALRPFLKRVRPWFRKTKGVATEPNDPEGWARFHAENEAELVAGKARFDRFGDPAMFVFYPRNEAENSILRALSCGCGENREFHGQKPEHAFFPLTDSLTDRRPILRHGGVCYAFNLAKLQREAYTLVGDVLRSRAPDYWQKKFLPARDAYLEAETARLFQRVLPSAQVLTTVRYPLAAGGETEADVLVLCDDVLLVVECKAGRLDPATKRGAQKKIISDLKETVAGGLNQAERFVRELVSQGVMKIRAGDRATEVTLHAAGFRYVMKVNVTLDLVAVAATELWKLAEAGLVSGVERGWSVSLNDLRVIVDVLDHPAAFMHYLLRRLDLNTLRSVRAGDELGYLMRHVRHGLFFREANALKENETVMLSGYTEELDQYFRRMQGLTEKGEKPKMDMGVRTTRMITALEEKRPQHWLSGCLELLEFDVPVREALLVKVETDHGPRLSDPRVAYAFSIMANRESRRGVLLASSRQPQRVRDAISARGIQVCRQHDLDEVLILLGAWPTWDARVIVSRVNGSAEVSGNAARLLDQLIIRTTYLHGST